MQTFTRWLLIADSYHDLPVSMKPSNPPLAVDRSSSPPV